MDNGNNRDADEQARFREENFESLFRALMYIAADAGYAPAGGAISSSRVYDALQIAIALARKGLCPAVIVNGEEWCEFVMCWEGAPYPEFLVEFKRHLAANPRGQRRPGESAFDLISARRPS